MSEPPRPLDYASPPAGPLRDGYAAAPGFFVGWAVGFGIMLGCTAFMCADEIWLPFALAFPHAAVATELIEGPTPGGGDGAFWLALLAAPLTHAVYGALLKHGSRLGLGIAAGLHTIFLVWSMKLPDPFLA